MVCLPGKESLSLYLNNLLVSSKAVIILMKHPFKALIVIGILFCTVLAAQTIQPACYCVSIDSGWKFTKEPQTDAQMPEFDDGIWRSLDLPHDWSIEGPYSETNPTGGSGGYLPAGVGWYRRHLTVPESMSGKKVIVQFDGVYMNSDVWLNGHHLGNYPYGYTSFYYDVTPWLNFDGKNNVLAVRVDNSKQPNSRWYSGSGIYRHVWLTATDPLHITHGEHTSPHRKFHRNRLRCESALGLNTITPRIVRPHSSAKLLTPKID